MLNSCTWDANGSYFSVIIPWSESVHPRERGTRLARGGARQAKRLHV